MWLEEYILENTSNNVLMTVFVPCPNFQASFLSLTIKHAEIFFWVVIV